MASLNEMYDQLFIEFLTRKCTTSDECSTKYEEAETGCLNHNVYQDHKKACLQGLTNAKPKVCKKSRIGGAFCGGFGGSGNSTSGNATTVADKSTTESAGSIGIIVAVVIGIVLIFIVVSAIVFFKKRQRNKKPDLEIGKSGMTAVPSKTPATSRTTTTGKKGGKNNKTSTTTTATGH
ncbi:unnamed protein product [Caenorhabditis sp. 36 PRJEB53466]|nr:unnamed protein product [Caenorhabditis sp. 36 PRJEB53466]